MKPPSFEYEAPTSVEAAIALLRDNEYDAKLLAGGQSLMPLLNMRMTRPALLIDLARVPGLDYVEEKGDALRIGAMTRQRTVELSDVVRKRHPLLHAALLNIAHPQNRNQGTIGGSLAHADPAAELPALALTLDAEMRAFGPNGERTIGASDFFVTYLTTALESTEILIETRFPTLPARTGWSVMEVARRHGDFALAGAMSTVTLDDQGRCAATRLVLFGVGATAVRARKAEQMLAGERPEAALLERAGRAVAEEIDEPLTDVHASADYRRDLAGVLGRRALAEAAARAA